jgi:hypothetical protein
VLSHFINLTLCHPLNSFIPIGEDLCGLTKHQVEEMTWHQNFASSFRKPKKTFSLQFFAWTPSKKYKDLTWPSSLCLDHYQQAQCYKSFFLIEPWKTRKSYWRERISTVDLLVLNSSDQLLFKLKLNFSFFTKQPFLMRRSTVPSLCFCKGSLLEKYPWLLGCGLFPRLSWSVFKKDSYDNFKEGASYQECTNSIMCFTLTVRLTEFLRWYDNSKVIVWWSQDGSSMIARW